MYDNKVCIIKEETYSYPKKETVFRPACRYSEYLFEEISDKPNEIYAMVRNCLMQLGLDKENIDTPDWNPLKKYISQGDIVLLKPNLVLDCNRIAANGLECLITHPSIVAAVMDYCIKAGGKRCKYIIGDAPLSDCKFDVLIEETGYNELVDFYRQKGYDVRLRDFRNVKINKDQNGIRTWQDNTKKEENHGIVVKLDEISAFNECAEERLERLRITDYDPRILKQHHNQGHHEYMIAKDILSADVIVNLPKPKTHRKAGITAALKNLVGINANKEYLPHHTLGSKVAGGDDFLTENTDLLAAEKYLDERNILNENGQIEEALIAESNYRNAYRKGAEKEYYFEGSWYGNDTIWRTIVDLNKILYYADKSGKMQNTIQRKVFIIGDMIISGHKEGPLAPEPLDCGIILGGEDPLLFDRVVCAIMGFDYKYIPTLNREEYFQSAPCGLLGEKLPYIISNSNVYDKKNIDEIKNTGGYGFVPTFGWQAVLGNSDIEKIKNMVLLWNDFINNKSNNENVYIFGAGKKGKEIYHKLLNIGVDVKAFIDNDLTKLRADFYNTVPCISLEDADPTGVYVVSILNLYEQTKIGIQIQQHSSQANIVFYYE